MGTGDCFPRGEVKNAWSYAFTAPYVSMAWCLVKHKDNFTFTLISTFVFNDAVSTENISSTY